MNADVTPIRGTRPEVDWDKLTAPLDAATEVSYLPKVWCRACIVHPSKVCDDHGRAQCASCRATVTTAHECIPYLGHADVTHRLNEHAAGAWSWAPLGVGPDGLPALIEHDHPGGTQLTMWATLTVGAREVLEVGTVDADKREAYKELVGDFLRRGMMRLGLGLELWRHAERSDLVDSAQDDPAALGLADEVITAAQVADLRKVFDVIPDGPQRRRALGEWIAARPVAIEFTPRADFLDTLTDATNTAQAVVDTPEDGLVAEARAARRGATLRQLRDYAEHRGTSMGSKLDKVDGILRLSEALDMRPGDLVAAAAAYEPTAPAPEPENIAADGPICEDVTVAIEDGADAATVRALVIEAMRSAGVEANIVNRYTDDHGTALKGQPKAARFARAVEVAANYVNLGEPF